jgi:signal transduction histidine kinase
MQTTTTTPPPRTSTPLRRKLSRLFRPAPPEQQSAIHNPQSAIARRPGLFALILAAFTLVIVLGVGGMVGFYALSVSGQETPVNEVEMRATVVPWDANSLGDPLLAPSAPGDIKGISPVITRSVPDDGSVIRGLISAGLALAAVLIGLATIFTRRLSRPITRLTFAARTMASGDLAVRVDEAHLSPVRELHELASAFNSMAASVSESDRRRRQLTADVAHELRTPLSIIKGRLEGMQDGIYGHGPDQIALLLNETALLERLIEDLRLLAQADAGQLPLYCEQLSLAHVLRSVAQSFAPAALQAGISLQIAPAPDLPEVNADPQRIAQVLTNLVSNALRHTPPGGSITLSAHPTADRNIVVSVLDTGSGIPPEDLPHVFDRFWKADRARSRSVHSGSGAGLGLAIARRIVEAHGGTIWARSQPAEGTAISFTLPALLPAYAEVH